MYHRNIFPFIVTILLCTGCGVNIANENRFTATPDFVTAALPPTLVSAAPTGPFATQTPIPPEAVPTISPIEGTTTTQVNVRAEPSTANESLGIIGAFVKVQVIGKDASGTWYQIIYTGSETGIGWIRAEYAQVNAPAEIPLVGSSAGSGSAMSGLVIQKINIRNGPGIGYESLGILSPNDVVFITGKDPSGAWMQIEFANAPEGTGWVASEFLQVSSPDSLPTIGETKQTKEAPTSIASTPTTVFLAAIEDGDSMQAPLAAILFSSTNARALQISGDVSAPDGDAKDWIQFSADNRIVVIEAICSNNVLQVELWNAEALADTFLLSCGDKQTLTITPNNWYFLSLSIPSANEPEHTNYILKLEVPR